MSAKQYVISAPTGFITASARRFSNQMLNLWKRRSVNILDAIHEDADKLVSITDEEVQQLKADFPSLVIEPNLRYTKFRHPLLENFEEISIPASTDTQTITVRVLDDITRAPIERVSLYLALDQTRSIGFRGVTDQQGEARFTTRAGTNRFDFLALLPKVGYWNRIVKNILVDGIYEVTLRPLPASQVEIYDWGHQFARMRDGLSSGGAGVKIAVVDTGIRRDHPDLAPAGGRNCVYGEDETRWYDDEDGHGSHCAGIIGATLSGSGLKGYAPQAEIHAYRVFSAVGGGATTYDIAKAIQRAVEDGCDIISMSLGSDTPQVSIRTKIELAYEHGVMCIAATGNEGAAVRYPAAFPLVAAVGAFGKFGSYPDDSLHRENESLMHSSDGEYYTANFSNFGPEVDFCAPGVAIQSTVPGGYSAWDGTSMACPQITGMAALVLASRPDILNAPRDSERVERLVKLLKDRAQPLGFGANYEGTGVLQLDRLLER